MFQRLPGRTPTGGNGIGLAGCHRIVERHGRRIWTEANAGAEGEGGGELPFTPRCPPMARMTAGGR